METVNEHSRFLPPVPSQKSGGSNRVVKSASGSYLRFAGTSVVTADTRHALHTTGKSGAAVSVFQQWAERWVGIQAGRAIGAGNHAQIGSWVKTIAVRLGM